MTDVAETTIDFNKIPHRAEWAAALRSGQYKQARNRLYSSDGYCCLGVWARVAGYNIHPEFDGVIADNLNHGYGPIKYALGEQLTSALAGLNDRLEWSFDQIADFIDGKGPSIEAVEALIEEHRSHAHKLKYGIE